MTTANAMDNRMDKRTVDERLLRECTDFLFHEAELLDAWNLDAWIALLTPDIDYRMPVRTTRMKENGDGFSRKAYVLEEDIGSIRMRAKRLASEFAWSENPRTRTRHMVSNVRVVVEDAAGDTAGCINVKSNVAVFCHRGDEPAPVILTGERQDVLQNTGDGLRLKRRVVLLDTTVIGMDAFSIFI